MSNKNEDRSLFDFFESLLGDPIEREILKLILADKEDSVIIDALLNRLDKEDDALPLQEVVSYD